MTHLKWKNRIRTMTGVITTLFTVWVGSVLLSAGHTIIGAALCALGALRAFYVLRDIWWYLTPEDEDLQDEAPGGS